jgi:IS4 transposase
LYGDQEFSYACLIDIYNELDIDYIVRAKGDYIYRKEKKTNNPTFFEYVFKRYENKNPVFTTTKWVICIFKDKKGKIKKESFFTNKKVTHSNKNKFYQWYDKRWGIETDYRSNNVFMPKTSAKNYVVRFFYFVLCSILRNIWVFINLKIKARLGIKIRSKPVLTADDFIFLVFKIYNISI